jgi:hypothetical protein
MYSIRRHLGLPGAAALGLSLVAGCVSFERVLPDPAPDEATVLRGWEPQTYIYPSGAVFSGPTYITHYENRTGRLRDDYAYMVAQPAIFLGDIATLPLKMMLEQPTSQFTDYGVHYPPSMTVAPPLPEE